LGGAVGVADRGGDAAVEATLVAGERDGVLLGAGGSPVLVGNAVGGPPDGQVGQ